MVAVAEVTAARRAQHVEGHAVAASSSATRTDSSHARTAALSLPVEPVRRSPAEGRCPMTALERLDCRGSGRASGTGASTTGAGVALPPEATAGTAGAAGDGAAGPGEPGAPFPPGTARSPAAGQIPGANRRSPCADLGRVATLRPTVRHGTTLDGRLSRGSGTRVGGCGVAALNAPQRHADDPQRGRDTAPGSIHDTGEEQQVVMRCGRRDGAAAARPVHALDPEPDPARRRPHLLAAAPPPRP